MAPKSKIPNKKNTKKPTSCSEDGGMFSGMFVFLVDSAVQPRRLQIWKQRLEQMGAKIEGYLSKRVTHIFAMNWDALQNKIDSQRLSTFKGTILLYQWLEDSLRSGEKVAEDFYLLKEEPGGGEDTHQASGVGPQDAIGNTSGDTEAQRNKKLKSSPQNSRDSIRSFTESSRDSGAESRGTATSDEQLEESITSRGYDGFSSGLNQNATNHNGADASHKSVSDLPYNPPDLNKNVTDIFKKLIDIYRALGDDRRSFSYYKAIPVIEGRLVPPGNVFTQLGKRLGALAVVLPIYTLYCCTCYREML